MSDAQQAIARRLARQARACERVGSPLYATMLERLADDTEAGGVGWLVLRGHEHDPPGSALGLRLMGAVHRLALNGELKDLAMHYPSTGGDGDREAAWRCLREALREHAPRLRELASSPVQTNEVGRSAALIGGFLTVAQLTGMPLRVLEVGASAGLNLLFDRYFYASERSSWGSADSAVRLEGAYVGDPPFDADLTVVQRLGCDLRALDPADAEDRLTLRSYVWPDQALRLNRLDEALQIAASLPVGVERADAADWLERRLAQQPAGVASVVFHSIFAQYLAAEDRLRMARLLADAGGRATPKAPFAWLRMEPEPLTGAHAEVRLTLWPGGTEKLLATSGYHGDRVRWL
ncbi:MAG TPA: DUF2332 domain-containing protein [Solirubrobacteraceae bacterium]